MDESDEVRSAWDANAEHWDKSQGEGKTFALELVAPAEEALYEVKPGHRVLEIACGNGLHSRRLASRGAKVTATDLSPRMIEIAKAKTPAELEVEYRVLDATDAQQLSALPPSFDAIVCHMAVFDMSRVDALFAAAAERLGTGAPFIVSSAHPCFNQPNARFFAEAYEQADGTTREEHGVRVVEYARPFDSLVRAHHDSPAPHRMFHRPLSLLLSEAFAAGLVLTGLREPTMPTKDPPRRAALSWDARFAAIPAVIVYRFEARR
jgi:SAM-dependent methyltransferase